MKIEFGKVKVSMRLTASSCILIWQVNPNPTIVMAIETSYISNWFSLLYINH